MVSRQKFKIKKVLTLWYFPNFDLVEINRSNKSIDKVDVWLGKESQVNLRKPDIYKTIKKLKKDCLKLF